MVGTRVGAEVKGLNGLRALAVSLVYFHHHSSLGIRFGVGAFGLWLFLCLSGFLVVSRLHADELTAELDWRAKLRRMTGFYGRRARRILPSIALFFIVISTLATLRVVQPIPTVGWLSVFTFTTNLWISSIDRWPATIAHLWSLSVQEQFYIVAGLAFIWLPPRRHVAVCLVIILAGCICLEEMHRQNFSHLSTYISSPANFAVIAYGGLVGILGAAVGPGSGHRSLASAGVLAAYLSVPIALGLLGMDQEHAMPFSMLSFLLVGPMLVFIKSNQQSWFVRALEFAAIRYIGKISFAMYLYHSLIDIDGIVRYLNNWLSIAIPVASHGANIINYLLLVAVSAASWEVFERRFLPAAARTTRSSQATIRVSAEAGA